MQIAHSTTRRVLTYAVTAEADVRASNLRQDGAQMHFDLHLPDTEQHRCDSSPMWTTRVDNHRITGLRTGHSTTDRPMNDAAPKVWGVRPLLPALLFWVFGPAEQRSKSWPSRLEGLR